MLELWQCRERVTNSVLQEVVTFTLMAGRGRYPVVSGVGVGGDRGGERRRKSAAAQGSSMDEGLKVRNSMSHNWT